MTNPEILQPYFDQGRSVILAGGHYGNWELFAVAIRQSISHEAVALYKPLSNAYFDELMRRTRSKYGLEMVSVREVKPLFENLADRKPTLLIFGSDQSPGDPRKAYWMEFLNQDTAVMFGIEKYALEYNLPVFYGKITPLRRGYSNFSLELLVDAPAGLRHGEITERHTRRLEKDIIAEPRYWLWTHRRWKRKRSEISDVPEKK